MKQFSYAFLVVCFIFSSCSSTKLINSWSDKENTPNTYEKIGVTVLFPNSSNRYVTEHAVVDHLKEKGLKAMPTVDVFPLAGRVNQGDELLKKSETIRNKVKEKVTESNIDALMIITLFDMTKEKRWVNDRALNMGGTGFYGTPYGMHGAYYDYYAYSMGTIYNNGYYTDDINYFIECNLYDIESEKLIWRAQTKSKNVESVEEEAKKLAYIIAKQLLSKKVVNQ